MSSTLWTPSTDPRLSIAARCGATLGECPVWSVSRKSLVCVDILGRTIFEVAENGDVRRHATDDWVSAVVPAGGTRWIAALRRGLCTFDLESGRLEDFHVPPGHDAERLRFNDSKCDPQGRVWVGSVSLDNLPDVGVLYRIDSRDLSRAVIKNLSVPNGLAWSPSGEQMYFIDSPTKRVRIFSFNASTSEITGEGLSLDLSGTPGFPDGCTVDERGCLWIAHWGGAQVSCWDPRSRREVDRIRLPVSQVTSCTFGGLRLDRLYITTAAHELPAQRKDEESHAGDLFVANVTYPGFPPITATVN